MKKVLAVCLAMVMCLTLLPMTALAVDSDFKIEDGVLVSYHGRDEVVVIPDGVTEIGEGAFSVLRGIHASSIIMPDSVTVIHDFAFMDCYNLTSITLSKNLTSIGGIAFKDCRSLTSITIPDSVTTIGSNAFGGTFSGCSSLTSIVIPDSVTSIARDTFAGCTSLADVTIGNGVTTIDTRSFYGLPSLTSIVIPDSVTVIADGAFENCKALTSVTIGNGVTIIEDYAFRGCSAITDLSLGSGLKTIGKGAFANCSGLRNLIIPNGVTTIEDGVFTSCHNLTITVPDSLTNISNKAFSHINNNATIYGSEGSAIQSHIEANYPYYTFIATGGTTTQTEPATPIEAPSSWAQADVTTAISNNLVPQNLQSSYTQAITRAEFAALAVTLYEQITGTTITERQTFSDTSDINVEKAAAIGVVSGTGDNQFAPNSPLTREQAATMLSRLADAIGKPLTKGAATFADNNSVSSWAIEAVGQMQATGIMGGVGDNTFAPASDYTREQSIVTVLRLYDVLQSDSPNTNNAASNGNLLNGTYQWTGDYPDMGGETTLTYIFKPDGTVTKTRVTPKEENNRTSNDTYYFHTLDYNDRIFIRFNDTGGAYYEGLFEYHPENDTITVNVGSVSGDWTLIRIA